MIANISKVSLIGLLSTSALVALMPLRAYAADPCPAADGNGLVTVTSADSEACSLGDGESLRVENGATIMTVPISYNVELDSVSAGYIINFGTIGDGSANAGIYILSSNLYGDIDNSGQIINNGTIHAYNAIDIRTSYIEGLINNADGIITDGGGSTGFGLRISNASDVDGDINNAGLIEGGEGGIIIDSSTLSGKIINSGTISTYQDGFTVGAIGLLNLTSVSEIENSGTIENKSSVGYAIKAIGLDNDLIINNSGTVKSTLAGGYAIYMQGQNTSTNVTIDNSGTISTAENTDYAIYTDQTLENLIINNSGTIEGIISLTGGGTINLNGDEARVVGAIDGGEGGPGEGTTVNVNGDFTVEDQIDVSNININDGGTLHIGSVISTLAHTGMMSMNFTNSGTFDVAQVITVISDATYNQTSDATLYITAASAADYGKLYVEGDVNIDDGAKIYVDVTAGNTLAVDDILAGVIEAGSTLTVSGDIIVNDNSKLFNFTAQENGLAIDLNVIADDSISVQQIALDSGVRIIGGIAPVLDDIIANNPGGNFGVLIGAMQGLTTNEEVVDAAEQLLPLGLGGGDMQAVLGSVNGALEIVGSRLDEFTGIGAGDSYLLDGSYWAQPFGSWAEYDGGTSDPGYAADTYGMLFGVDGHFMCSDNILGFAFAYSNSAVDGKGSSDNTSMNVNNYQLMAYGSHVFLDPSLSMNLNLSLGISNNDGKRRVNFGGIDMVAESDYIGYNAKMGAGFNKAYIVKDDITFVTGGRVDYAWVKSDGYTETGAAPLNYTVGSRTVQELIPSAEAGLQKKISKNTKLSGKVGVGYDLLAESSQIVSTFVGGGSSFTSVGTKPSPWVVSAEADMKLADFHGAEVTTRYRYETRGSEYQNHSVAVKVGIDF